MEVLEQYTMAIEVFDLLLFATEVSLLPKLGVDILELFILIKEVKKVPLSWLVQEMMLSRITMLPTYQTMMMELRFPTMPQQKLIMTRNQAMILYFKPI